MARQVLIDIVRDDFEEFGEFGFHPVVLVPFTAEAEAMRQPHSTVERLTAAVPRANIVLAENQRDGLIVDLHPASTAWQERTDKLRPAAEENALIVTGRWAVAQRRLFSSPME